MKEIDRHVKKGGAVVIRKPSGHGESVLARRARRMNRLAPIRKEKTVAQGFNPHSPKLKLTMLRA